MNQYIFLCVLSPPPNHKITNHNILGYKNGFLVPLISSVVSGLQHAHECLHNNGGFNCPLKQAIPQPLEPMMPGFLQIWGL